jgi:phosphomethylpyrimidine synthase
VCGIVPRGSAGWMSASNSENPSSSGRQCLGLQEVWDDYQSRCGLHEGNRGSLTKQVEGWQRLAAQLPCTGKGVQAIIEGPGHVPIDQIPAQISQKQLCDNAPFMCWGHTDITRAGPYNLCGGAIGYVRR